VCSCILFLLGSPTNTKIWQTWGPQPCTNNCHWTSLVMHSLNFVQHVQWHCLVASIHTVFLHESAIWKMVPIYY
jgi:hypothetical protein